MVGSILRYARAFDLTVVMTISIISTEQAQATNKMINNAKQFLNYLSSNPNAMMQYYASGMILNIHSDALYLSDRNSKSRSSGIFLLVWIPCNGKPIKINGAIYMLCTILKFVALSAAEAELGALFINLEEARIVQLTLA